MASRNIVENIVRIGLGTRQARSHIVGYYELSEFRNVSVARIMVSIRED